MGVCGSGRPSASGRIRKNASTLLKKAGVDLVVVDTAHGHSQAVLDTVKMIKKQHPDLELVAGNIATAEAAKDLSKVGVDAVKVGVGPGSICTTRIVSGAGMPQLTAIADCAKVLEGSGVPIIADGGIKFSGDISEGAWRPGPPSVMLGGLLAGTEESPGETVLYQARTYKVYRGMGSIGAMERGGAIGTAREGAHPRSWCLKGSKGVFRTRARLSAVIYQLVGRRQDPEWDIADARRLPTPTECHVHPADRRRTPRKPRA